MLRANLLRIVLFLLALPGLGLFGCQAHNQSGITTPSSLPPEADEKEEIDEPPVKVVINIPERNLTLFRESEVVFQFPVAVGAPWFKTPVGPRFLRGIVWNPWWIPPDSPWAAGEKPTPPGPKNPLGPVKMDLGEALLLHGTNKEDSVGQSVSHGCMRMFNADAKKMAWWLQKHFTDKKDKSLLKEYEENRGRSYYVFLNQPVPVEIIYDVFRVEDGYFESHPDLYWKVGDRKQKAHQALFEAGYAPHQIHENALERLLNLSEKQTARISLKELMPGKLMVSSTRISDPVDEAWRKKTI